MKKIRAAICYNLSGRKVDGFSYTKSTIQSAEDFNEFIKILIHHLAAHLVLVFGKYTESFQLEHIEVKVSCGNHSCTVLDIWGVMPMDNVEIDEILSKEKVSEKIQNIVLDYILSQKG